MTDWSQLPSESIESVTLSRIHLRDHRPEWFGTGASRFDPPAGDKTRFGTCYLSLHPLGAYVEVFGRFRAVTEEAVSARALAELRLARPVRLADLTDRRIVSFGLTAEHSTGTDYEITQRLAGELFDAGFDGIYYRVRHDPPGKLTAVALFGEPGLSAASFVDVKSQPIPPALVAQAREEFGILVLPSAELP